MKTRLIVTVLVAVLLFGCSSNHKNIVIKSMRQWGDDSKKCQLLNGNQAIEGTPKPKSEPEMYCYDDPNPPAFEKWQFTYVGTVKLDNDSEREFGNDKKWKVEVICTRTHPQTFECVHGN